MKKFVKAILLILATATLAVFITACENNPEKATTTESAKDNAEDVKNDIKDRML